MRIRYTPVLNKITTAEKAEKFIKDGMVVATSGFTKSGETKVVLPALSSSNRKFEKGITLLSGASLSNNIDGQLAKSGKLSRRMPFQSDKALREAINSGKVMYSDQHLAETADLLQNKQISPIDIAIIEVSGISENGNLRLTSSIGNSCLFAILAKQIILEVNSYFPENINHLHDYYVSKQANSPLPLTSVEQRIGSTELNIDLSKVVAIVETNIPDECAEPAKGDEKTELIGKYLIRFFEQEVKLGKMPKNLKPLQVGVGKIANAVLNGIINSRFEDLVMYSEVLQDSTLDLLDSGKLKFASGSAYTFSQDHQEHFYANFERYKDKLILRPQYITNSAELIHRLGVIAINTAIEADIYGNVNSTHLNGTHIMNGIGGSDEFARNAMLSIFVCPSTSKENTISHIVPMVTHVDHSEHDVDILVTEIGLADLRGLAPRERAIEIINNCVNPEYKEQMLNYFERAKENGGQTPHLLDEAFSWHLRFKEKWIDERSVIFRTRRKKTTGIYQKNA